MGWLPESFSPRAAPVSRCSRRGAPSEVARVPPPSPSPASCTTSARRSIPWRSSPRTCANFPWSSMASAGFALRGPVAHPLDDGPAVLLPAVARGSPAASSEGDRESCERLVAPFLGTPARLPRGRARAASHPQPPGPLLRFGLQVPVGDGLRRLSAATLCALLAGAPPTPSSSRRPSPGQAGPALLISGHIENWPVAEGTEAIARALATSSAPRRHTNRRRGPHTYSARVHFFDTSPKQLASIAEPCAAAALCVRRLRRFRYGPGACWPELDGLISASGPAAPEALDGTGGTPGLASRRCGGERLRAPSSPWQPAERARSDARPRAAAQTG